MSDAREPATASATVRVAVAPARAFELFTLEIDAWWRRGPKFRHAGAATGELVLEPLLGGRVYERWRAEGELREFELGRIRVWEPPQRFVFGWRNATFAPLEDTEVEVTFVASGSGTLVTVRHRGWEALRPDHPARHGHSDAGFASSLGLWWADQLVALRLRAAGAAP